MASNYDETEVVYTTTKGAALLNYLLGNGLLLFNRYSNARHPLHRTVETLRSTLTQKLEIKNAADPLNEAIRRGLIAPFKFTLNILIPAALCTFARS